jgi:translation initiation factor IF-3
VRLITEDNENIGVVPTKDALERAQQAELDLVEVAPNADPPVCRIMDFGKFLYAKAKKEREAKKQQKQIEVKEGTRSQETAKTDRSQRNSFAA